MAVVLPYGENGLYSAGSPLAKSLRNIAVPNGLITYWALDGDAINGTIAIDLSHSGGNGTIIGAVQPLQIPGAIGSALQFNAVSNAKYVAGSQLLNIPLVSISAWIRFTAAPGGNSGFIAGFSDGYGSGTNDKNLFIDTDGKLYFYAFDGSTKVTSAPSAIVPTNVWVHVAATMDGTTALTYVNAIQVGSVSCGNGYTGYSSPNFFFNGDSGGGSNTHPTAWVFDGDEVRLYNRCLAPWEIIELYQAGIAGRRDAGIWLSMNAESPILQQQITDILFAQAIM